MNNNALLLLGVLNLRGASRHFLAALKAVQFVDLELSIFLCNDNLERKLRQS